MYKTWCLLVCVATVVVASPAQSVRPSYVGCLDSNECGPKGCCALGPSRYSSPTCHSMAQIGDSCRPESLHLPFNATLTYPDQQTVVCTNIYYIFCRCDEGLECDLSTSSCQPAKTETNSVD